MKRVLTWFVRGCLMAGAVLACRSGFALDTQLAWDPPTQNVDGSAITDIAGYKLHYGVASGNYSDVLDVPGSGTTCTVPGLTEGTTYYFSARTYNTGGLLSEFCPEIVWKAPDVTAPAIPAMAPVTLSAGANGQAAVPNFWLGVTPSDNCSAAAAIIVSQNPTAGTLAGLGLTVVTVSATDEAGNTATAPVNVTVVDTTAPVMVAPAPVTLTADLEDNAQIPDFRGVVVSDNCTAAGEIVVAQLPAPGTQVTLGETVVTLTATDAAGNASQCTVAVTVVPCNKAPVVSAGSPATITLPVNNVTLTGSFTDDGLPEGSTAVATWSMASGPAAVSFGNANALSTTVSFTEAGTYVLKLTVSDGELSASATVTVTVNARPNPNPPTRLRVLPML